jgi:hypothetical protein
MNPTCPQLMWGREELRGRARPTISWLWHGLVARGNITLLTSHWKAGKTTLVSVLLHHLKKGGTFAGRSLEPGRAVVISEESPDLWNSRAETLDFTDHIGWYCRPFAGRPRPEEWLALLEQIHKLHAERSLALVVIDPLAAFLATGSENEAGCIIEALTPLQRLASAGPAILLLHHPRRKPSRLGQSARGSGSLLGFCDILLEMRRFRQRDPDDRRRKLYGQARYAETPHQLVIELNAEGTDYVFLGRVDDLRASEYWQILRPILQAAPHKLTRRELLDAWPGGPPRNPVAIYAWLQNQVAAGVIRQDGTGVKDSPYRYWLPEREAVWRADPLAFLTMPEL